MFNPQNPEILELSRQRKMADLLTSRGMETPQAQTVAGGVYVPPNPMEYLAKLFSTYAGTKAMGGNTQQANMAKESFSAIKDFVNSPAAFSEILFNPNSKQALIDLATSKSVGQKGLDALITIGKVGGTAALRGAPMLSIEKAPDSTSEQPTGTVDVRSLSDAELIQRYQQQNPDYTPPQQENPIFQQQ